MMLTERSIQDGLWLRLRNKNHAWMCPNYTPRAWWEMDMFSLTKAGLMVEHEIKMSAADFRADFGKSKDVYQLDGQGLDITQDKKHDRLASGDIRGPSRFYYVVPDEMLKAHEVPSWAGLLYAIPPNAERRYVRFFEVKKAPKLHQCPACPEMLEHLRGIFFWRFWNLRLRMKEPEDQPVAPFEEKS